MIPRRLLAMSASIAIAVGVAEGTAVRAAAPPTTWDGLVLVESKQLDRVYLLPEADFKSYNKVMLEPTEVAFKENWIRDYNSSASKTGKRLDQNHADQIVKAVSTGMGETFAQAYRKAGYQIVQSAGPGVLRVRTGVINLAITAPDVRTAGRSRTWSRSAGEATLVVEARDSETGALLGRALDRRAPSESRMYLRNSVTNRADFQAMFDIWAKASVEELGRLKAMSPASGASAVASEQ
ncbi:MAG TPA: DUF3313 family protein [Caulobacteraceae bacterium]